jgi:hypothetical protein
VRPGLATLEPGLEPEAGANADPFGRGDASQTEDAAALGDWRRCIAARERGRRTSSYPKGADGMLKLMLILLAFFVLLHSRSEPSLERSEPILDSLALRFAATTEPSGDETVKIAAREFDPATTLRRRLVGHLPISAGPVEVPGALLAFDLDETALFAPEAAAIVRDRLVLLHRLGNALAEPAAGRETVLVITTTWPAATTTLTAARLRTLQAVFADTALEPTRLRLGLSGLPEGTWRFAIRAGDEHAG